VYSAHYCALCEVLEVKLRCDQCEALMINGVFCHETGCPNSKKTYRYGAWIRVIECFECGCEVEDGTVCNCQDSQVAQ
jgi:hypothetical protein